MGAPKNLLRLQKIQAPRIRRSDAEWRGNGEVISSQLSIRSRGKTFELPGGGRRRQGGSWELRPKIKSTHINHTRHFGTRAIV